MGHLVSKFCPIAGCDRKHGLCLPSLWKSQWTATRHSKVGQSEKFKDYESVHTIQVWVSRIWPSNLMFVCMYVCMYVCMCIYIIYNLYIIYIYNIIYIYICIYIYMYVYVYIYIHMYIMYIYICMCAEMCRPFHFPVYTIALLQIKQDTKERRKVRCCWLRSVGIKGSGHTIDFSFAW